MKFDKTGARAYSSPLLTTQSPAAPHACPTGHHEKNISTQCTQTQTHARLSCPHGHPQRTPGAEGAPRQGPRPAQRITTRTALAAADRRFPKERRLLRPEEFQRVFQNPCRSGDAALLVLARGNGLGHARLGLAISVKSARSAVVRNRIKRIVRESFRHRQGTLGALDFVVTARAGVGTLSGEQLRTALERHWSSLASCKKS